MKIVFCTKGDRMLPSSRTRAHLMADYLRVQGYNAESYHIKTYAWWHLSRTRYAEFRNNLRLLRSLKKDDVLYLHKLTNQLEFMAMVLIRKWVFRRGYYFDFDDAIFVGSWNVAFKTALMVRCAEAIIVSSHFLMEYASLRNSSVHLLSAPIDTDGVYLPAAKRIDDPRVRIGWTGTPPHLDNMRLLVRPLQRIVDDRDAIVFVQLGGGDKINALLRSVKDMPIEYVPSLPWNDPKAVVAHLQQFDIGVMPLQKNEHERGKDAWKAKEYMGCGVATVLSDWGENPYVVDGGVDGILVDTEDDWYRALKRLINDGLYRKRIGAAGRARMQREYSNEAIFKAFVQIVGLTKE